MLVLQSGLLLILLLVCSLAPGFFLVRKLRWSPLEKLCGAVALSLTLLYIVSWGIYCLFPAIRGGASWAIAGICVGLAAAAYRDIARLLRSPRVRRASLGYAFLLLWTLIILAMIRNYSGLGWGADWLEHFQRTLFFLLRFPTNTPIISDYQVPSRPPMMNVLTAFFLAPLADRFELFQITFTALNLLLFLPCCLMLPALGAARRPRILPLVVMFAASPVVMVNATYAWTKSLTVFFVVFALWLYLAALRKKDSVRTIAAFASLAAGLLVHYSAGPYCVVLGAHYLGAVFWKRPRKWRELAALAGVCALLLATWFGWSIARYGAKATFQSNTSVTSAQKYTGNPVWKIVRNATDSVVPYIVRGRLHTEQLNVAGIVRDYAFSVYQMNLIFSMGLVGGPLVVWLLYRAARRPRPEWRFWRVVIPACVLLGIAAVGERDVFGSAHLTLIPLEALGIAWIAAVFPTRPAGAGVLKGGFGNAIAIAILAGCIVDFSLGVMLQAKMEALENTPEKTVFSAGLRPADGGFQIGRPTKEGLSVAAWENWFLKHRFELYQDFLNRLARFNSADASDRQMTARVRERLQQNMREDQLYWQGWWQRHQYHLNFLGDDTMEYAAVLPWTLWGLFLAMLLLLLRALRAPQPSRVSEPKPVPPKSRTASRSRK